MLSDTLRGRVRLLSEEESSLITAKSSDCSLSLYRLPEDRKIREVDIPQDFQTSVVIAPGVHKYYMSIRCSGTSSYKTQPYDLGATRYLRDPIDLGEIHLTRSKGN